jgi:hypothetical protein
MDDLLKFAARGNIAIFKAEFLTETDPARLKTLTELLATEEAKLLVLEGPEDAAPMPE